MEDSEQTVEDPPPPGTQDPAGEEEEQMAEEEESQGPSLIKSSPEKKGEHMRVSEFIAFKVRRNDLT